MTHKRARSGQTRPRFAVIEVDGVLDDGCARAHIVNARRRENARIVITQSGTYSAAPALGERALARLFPATTGFRDTADFEARIVKIFAPRGRRDETRRIFAIFTRHKGRATLVPVDRRVRHAPHISAKDAGATEPGMLVEVETFERGRRGRIIKTLGQADAPGLWGRIAVHTCGLREDFPLGVEDAAAHLDDTISLEGREDLTDYPLITIDPSDARDHDDAVCAAPDTDPKNPGGFIAIIAIADVAHYVQEGSALDTEACLRGNSAYLTDRVVPMLPPRLSDNLCSLKARARRPCLAVCATLDARGRKRGHRFMRGVMRSRAALAYEEVEDALNGRLNEKTRPLMDEALTPLAACFDALRRARRERGSLELALPERKAHIGKNGRIHLSEKTPGAAENLIEEFMICANIAAAETLVQKRVDFPRRVHPPPQSAKLTDMRAALDVLTLRAPPQMRNARDFNRLLAQAREKGINHRLITDIIMRAQSQAHYSADAHGHFGLNLRLYTHFTSPIRRYSDLLVHRALLGAEMPLPFALAGTAQHISQTERTAAEAEMQTRARYTAAAFRERVGEHFDARVSGLTRAGVFVRLEGSEACGAEGFVPASTLGGLRFDARRSGAFVSGRRGAVLRIGAPLSVRLEEALPAAGILRFSPVSPA